MAKIQKFVKQVDYLWYESEITDEQLVDFSLELTTPSIVYEQEKTELYGAKMDVASAMLSDKVMSRDWVYENLFGLSPDQYNKEKDLMVQDAMHNFRVSQIENEGNDPSESGESYGTPHDLASLYGNKRDKAVGPAQVPTGYNEKDPGRPVEKPQNYGSDKGNFSRDPIGKFDLLQDRKRFSMDWYYPILSGCLNDKERDYYIDKVFNDFYVEDIGVKCVIEEPWITVAETCEFIIALMISNRDEDAKKLLLDVLNICDKDNIPYMGWQYKENIFWPKEKPSWTSAAAILAADTILDFSNASDLFKKDQSNLY